MGKSVKRRAAVPADPEVLAEAVAVIAKLVAAEGAVPKTALAKHGIPRAHAADALEQLTASGLEVAGKFVRMPIEKQLADQLAKTGTLPLRSLDSYVQGASKRDATLGAGELVAAKRARFIVRSTELLLASLDTPALDDRDLARLESATARLAAAVKLARRKGGTLLRSDVEEALRGFTPAPAPAPKPATAPATESGAAHASKAASAAPAATSATPPAPRPTVLRDIRASIEEHRESSGLTWVPKLVRALGGIAARDAVHAELLRGARAGDLELRPESGMGRLSEEDAALCLAGPQGSRLSWVRRIEVKS